MASAVSVVSVASAVLEVSAVSVALAALEPCDKIFLSCFFSAIMTARPQSVFHAFDTPQAHAKNPSE